MESQERLLVRFAEEHEIVSAILTGSENGETITGEKTDGATVYTDGYMGGGAVYGAKSNRHLYGTDLAKAIRADLKTAGIKGVTIASKHGDIQATVTTTAEDILPELEFVESYQVSPSFGWIDYTDTDGMRKSVSTADYYNLPDDLRETIRLEHAYREYDRDYGSHADLNHYHLDKYTGFTEAGQAKLRRVLDIISAYRYDESNSMVDYFNTNFYITLYTKPAKA